MAQKEKMSTPAIWFVFMIVVVIAAGIAAVIKNHSQKQNSPNAAAAVSNANMELSNRMNTVTVSIYEDKNGSSAFLGSGIIISGKNVLTNAHIVMNKSALFVYAFAPTPASYPVALLRSDPANDLVLLRISDNSRFFETALLGNSDLVNRGDKIFAMGNAFGNGNIMMSGKVVNKNYSYLLNGQVQTCIRSDITISPGTCGGPVFNAKGEVLGVSNSFGNPENDFIVTPVNRALSLINSNMQAQMGTGQPFGQNV